MSLFRKINEIIVHCTAVKEISGQKLEDVRDYHVRVRGYVDVGYHYIIEDDGTIRIGRPIARRGAHAYGRNNNSIGIAYTGGLSATGEGVAGPNTAQLASLRDLIRSLQLVFDIPTSKVIGHRDTGANKDCPSFDVERWMITGEMTPSRNLA